MLKGTSYVISKTLPKAQAKELIDKIIEPVYGYRGGKAPENLVQLTYGLRQMQRNLEPKSLDFFENKQRVGYYCRISPD